MIKISYELQRKGGNAPLTKHGVLWNEMLSANDRMNPHVKAAITAHLRQLSAYQANHQGIYSERVYDEDWPAVVVVKVCPPTRRRMDPPNWYPTVKALIDGLTDAGIWTDDNSRVIPVMMFQAGCLSGSKKYRIDLTIFALREALMMDLLN